MVSGGLDDDTLVSEPEDVLFSSISSNALFRICNTAIRENTAGLFQILPV